ncbi:MAG: hypothetical protein LAN37_16510 [Acidobacteriia bacterium]|nr:hypothetical protein [Terriglobia bacterium]
MIRSMVACLVLMGTLLAQATPSSQKDLRDLIHAADRLPIEYRADLEFEILNRVTDDALKVQTLRSLFQAAPGAKKKLKEKDALWIGRVRHREIARAEVVLNLTSLDIQVRAVRMLMPAHRALALYRTIDFRIPSTDCSSPVVYDPADYYELLGELIGNNDSVRANQGAPVLDILEERLRRIASPMELIPAAKTIIGANLSGEELRRAISLYVAALNQLTATDREAGFLEFDTRLTNAVAELAHHAREKQLSRNDILLSYSSFLRRSLSGQACADRSADRDLVAARFNQVAADFSQSGGSPHLDFTDLRPSGASGVAVIERLPEGKDFLRLMKSVEDLRSMRGTDFSREALRDAIEEFRNKLESTPDRSGPCSACTFHLKTAMYLFLIDSTPPEMMPAVARSYVRFLARSELKEDAPMEWLFSLKRLLNQTRVATEAQKQTFERLTKAGHVLTGLPSPAAPQILDALQESEDDVLLLYLREQKVLKLKYFSPYEALTGARAPTID